MKADNNRRSRQLLFAIFLLYVGINGGLTYLHEPWRDEIHAWLLAKNMTVKELLLFSGYEGHPILWHIMLMPFAKTGCSIIWLNILSTVIVCVAAFFFLFYTQIPVVLRIIILYTIPFLYVFSAISRNYCLVLLAVVFICVLYDRKEERPFLYSIPITVLVFSHAFAWGAVAGLTITFYFVEVIKLITGRSTMAEKKGPALFAGLGLISASSIFVIVTMIHGRNSGYTTYQSDETTSVIIALSCMSVEVMIYAIWLNRNTLKEAVTLCLCNLFQILIYTQIYSSVGEQRMMLIGVFTLFYLVCTYKKVLPLEKINDSYSQKFQLFFSLNLYCLPLILLGGVLFKNMLVSDIRGNYSSGRELGEYIEEHLPSDATVLTVSGIFAQTVVPYTKKTIYDVVYDAPIEQSLYHVYDYQLSVDAIDDIAANNLKYEGSYLIVPTKVITETLEKEPFKLIIQTTRSYTKEDYALYVIEN